MFAKAGKHRRRLATAAGSSDEKGAPARWFGAGFLVKLDGGEGGTYIGARGTDLNRV